MEPTLEQSLQRIFGGRARPDGAVAATPPGGAAATIGPGDVALRSLAQRAWDAWQRSQEALRRGDWSGYGQEQRRLEEALRQLQPGQ
jgi:uncharacterized membrane protein (UPF0182 family)